MIWRNHKRNTSAAKTASINKVTFFKRLLKMSMAIGSKPELLKTNLSLCGFSFFSHNEMITLMQEIKNNRGNNTVDRCGYHG